MARLTVEMHADGTGGVTVEATPGEFVLLVGAAVLALRDAGLSDLLSAETMDTLRLRRTGPPTEITPDPTVQ